MLAEWLAHVANMMPFRAQGTPAAQPEDFSYSWDKKKIDPEASFHQMKAIHGDHS